MCWKRQSLAYNLSAPTQSLMNGPWAWNTSLARDKEPTQPVLGLSPCVGISFPDSRSVKALLSLLGACVSYGTWPTLALYLSSTGSRLGSIAQQQGCPYANRPAPLAGRDQPAIGEPTNTTEAYLALSPCFKQSIVPCSA